MNVMKIVAMAVLLIGVSNASMAFEEHKMQGGVAAPSAAQSSSGAAVNGAANGLGITTPDLATSKSSGTKIRIPGLGVIGEIPELDFKLDLLYGATQPKQSMDVEQDAQANGVMGRVRVPLKSP